MRGLALLISSIQQPSFMKALYPGIALMQRLRFAEKFILVCMLFMVPLGLTSYYLLHDMRERVASMEQRETGLQYLAAINPLLELISRHRGMSNGLLRGDSGFSIKITALKTQLQQALAQADAANRQWGAALAVGDDWQQLRNRWLALQHTATKLSADTSWQKHTELITNYLQLIYRISVTSTLFTTETSTLRHLVEVDFHHLPQLIETLGQLRGNGAGFIADRVITNAEQHALLLLLNSVKHNANEVARQWLFAFESSPELRTEFIKTSEQLQQTTDRYLQLVRQQGISTNRPQIAASDYFDTGTRVITIGYDLLHTSRARLQTSFDTLNQRLNRRMQWLEILLVAVPLLIIYLVIAFFVTTRQTTQQLQYVVTQLQQHKVPKLTQNVGRDELADIVRLFNRLSRQMIHKNEEESLLGELSILALRSESVAVLCDRTLVLLMGAHTCLGAKAPAHIQLLRGSGKRYIAAANYDASILTIPDSTPHIYQLSFGNNPMCCLPLIYQNHRLGELLLTLDDESSLIANKTLLKRIVDALVIAIVRLQATQTLEEREQALLRSNDELERFAYVASHDLQEPLRKICSFGDRLQSRAGLEGRNLDFLSRMVGAAGRMQLLIQDLLTFSRIHASTRPFSPVDLNQIAARAIDTLEIAIKECDGKVQASPLPTIDGDPVQLEQLLQNLIGNAIKYRRPDVTPRILLQMIEEQVQDNGEKLFLLQCQDNGIGFEQKYADQIFEAFKRLHGRKEYSGSGIGLAVCRRIVERHGGTIHATSTPDQGTCIHFSLQMKHREE